MALKIWIEPPGTVNTSLMNALLEPVTCREDRGKASISETNGLQLSKFYLKIMRILQKVQEKCHGIINLLWRKSFWNSCSIFHCLYFLRAFQRSLQKSYKSKNVNEFQAKGAWYIPRTESQDIPERNHFRLIKGSIFRNQAKRPQNTKDQRKSENRNFIRNHAT